MIKGLVFPHAVEESRSVASDDCVYEYRGGIVCNDSVLKLSPASRFTFGIKIGGKIDRIFFSGARIEGQRDCWVTGVSVVFDVGDVGDDKSRRPDSKFAEVPILNGRDLVG